MVQTSTKRGQIMAVAKLTIQQWGNSLAVRIPASIARAKHFRVGQEVEMTTEEIGVSVKPADPRSMSLAQRLEGFDRARFGGDMEDSGNVGAEVF
jgi:antitoxin MazE